MNSKQQDKMTPMIVAAHAADEMNPVVPMGTITPQEQQSLHPLATSGAVITTKTAVQKSATKIANEVGRGAVLRQKAAGAQIQQLPGVQQKKKLPLSQKLMVGGVAGVVGMTATFPLDVVKTRLQSQVPDPVTGKMPYTSAFQCARTILRQEGIMGFYKGLPPAAIGVVPEKAIKLGVNDFLSELLEDPAHPGAELPLKKQLLAGGVTGALTVVATNPYEIVKIRLQTQQGLAAAERQSALQIARGLGVRGMYSGMFSTMSRDIPYALVFFPMYAQTKHLFTPSNGEPASVASIIAAGTLAGGTAAGLVTPMDVIKTRRQVRGANFKNMFDAYRHVVGREGYGALIQGALPRVMVSGPLFGITCLAFEMQKRYMEA